MEVHACDDSTYIAESLIRLHVVSKYFIQKSSGVKTISLDIFFI